MTEISDSTRYLYEKFRAGLEILAEHPGPIKERLQDAYEGQMMRGDRTDSDLPDELRERIDRFHQRMTGTPSDVEAIGTIRASLNGMTDEDACDMAREVSTIESELSQLGADRWPD